MSDRLRPAWNGLVRRLARLPSWRPRLVIFLLCLLWCHLCVPDFSVSGIRGFGYSPMYVDIAKTSWAAGKYARSVRGTIIDEVQREPLYPLAVMGAMALQLDVDAVTAAQKVCMVVALFLWASLARQRFGWAVTLCLLVLMTWDPVPAFYAGVLYPYAFQFLLVTAAMRLLIRGVEHNGVWSFVLAGACLAGANYERGSYLLLPAVLAVVLILLRRRLRLGVRGPLAFAMACYLLLAPWLARNAALGVYGMNQLAGYCLALTYGPMPGGRESPDAAYQRQLMGRDWDRGTLDYIDEQVVTGRASFQEADRKLLAFTLARMKHCPGHVAGVVAKNMLAFPCHLGGVGLTRWVDPEEGPPMFWRRFAIVRWADLADLVAFFLAVAGLWAGCRRLDVVAILGTVLLLYTLVVSTTVIAYDPRFRGPLDPILFIYAACFVRWKLGALPCSRNGDTATMLSEQPGGSGGGVREKCRR